MKKLLILTALSASTALAGNYAQLNATTKVLAGALQGAFDGGVSGIRHYIPGYGYHIAISGVLTNDTSATAIKKIQEVLKQLAPTVKGLDKNEYLSVAFKGSDKNMNDYEILVRQRGNTVETFLNGKKR